MLRNVCTLDPPPPLKISLYQEDHPLCCSGFAEGARVLLDEGNGRKTFKAENYNDSVTNLTTDTVTQLDVFSPNSFSQVISPYTDIIYCLYHSLTHHHHNAPAISKQHILTLAVKSVRICGYSSNLHYSNNSGVL